MSDSTPVMLRLAKSELPRLDHAAKRMGTNRSALAKFLLRTFLDKFEQGGFSALPHDWESIMHGLDGRTYAQQQIQALRAAETPGKSATGKLPHKPVTYSAAKKPRKKPRP
jgi:hypothetical protein